VIKRHHKLSYIRKDLSRNSSARWVAQAPAELVESLLASKVALASWMVEVRPDLLEKNSVGILILGSMMDGFDNGAWWTLFPTLMDKGADWVKITAGVPESEGDIKRLGCVPTMPSLEKSVKIVRGGIKTLMETDLGEIDVVYLPHADVEAWGAVLGHDHNIWKFLDQGAALVVGFLDAADTPVCLDVCDQFGLSGVRQMRNRFFDSSLEEMPQAMLLISARGSKPVDLDSAAKHAANLTEIIEVIRGTDGPGLEPEDYKLWGIRSIIKSSLDASDHYISMPRSLAIRASTGKIYRVKSDLVEGQAFTQSFEPGFMSEYPEEGSHWTARVFWAARAWDSGVGKTYNNTLGSKFDALGGMNDEGMSDFIEMISGGPSENATRLTNFMTGGGKYSPSKVERMLFDYVERGDETAVMDCVKACPSLLDSFNQDRLPLLVMLGMGDMVVTMKNVIFMGADPHARDGGERPVIVTLARSGTARTVEVLLDAGVDPDCQDALGWTPLLVALKSRRWETVQLLLDHGADTNKTNSLGMSPKSIASDSESDIERMGKPMLETMERLLGQGALSALSKVGLGLQSSDIPRELRERILGS
jgi:hypothetical protein